jgi:hypothetical protein
VGTSGQLGCASVSASSRFARRVGSSIAKGSERRCTLRTRRRSDSLRPRTRERATTRRRGPGSAERAARGRSEADASDARREKCPAGTRGGDEEGGGERRRSSSARTSQLTTSKYVTFYSDTACTRSLNAAVAETPTGTTFALCSEI